MKMESTCANCGAPVSGKWCGECGAAVQVPETKPAAAPAAAETKPAATSTPSYTPAAKAEASNKILANTLAGKDSGSSDRFLAEATVIQSSGAMTELKLDSGNPKFVDGSNYRLKLANESVTKHVMGLWDAGIKSGTMGVSVTGIYMVMSDTSVTEDFVSFSMQMGKDTDNMQGYWCANSEQSLNEVLTMGFKTTTNLSFALDPMDAIRGNATGPKKVIVTKLVLKNSRTVAGKVIIPVGRGACATYIVNYRK